LAFIYFSHHSYYYTRLVSFSSFFFFIKFPDDNDIVNFISLMKVQFNHFVSGKKKHRGSFSPLSIFKKEEETIRSKVEKAE